MPKSSHTDSVLGKITSDKLGWHFTFPMAHGRTGRFTIITSDARLTEECLIAVRHYVRSFRRADASLRKHIANKMFKMWKSNWYDPEIDHTRTKLGFQRKISLSGINFYWDERWASVVYNDGDLFGGHGIELSTDHDGNITREPTMFG